MPRRCRTITCGHKAPFWTTRGDADKEGNWQRQWMFRKFKNGRKQQYPRSTNRAKQPGSNEQEPQHLQATPSFQPERPGADSTEPVTAFRNSTLVTALRNSTPVTALRNSRSVTVLRNSAPATALGNSTLAPWDHPLAAQEFELQRAKELFEQDRRRATHLTRALEEESGVAPLVQPKGKLRTVKVHRVRVVRVEHVPQELEALIVDPAETS